MRVAVRLAALVVFAFVFASASAAPVQAQNADAREAAGRLVPRQSTVWARGSAAPASSPATNQQVLRIEQGHGRRGVIMGAVLGGLAGAVFGRAACRHAAADDQPNCAPEMLVFGGGGALAGALIGYVIGAGNAPAPTSSRR